jgi:hypothetical protein
MAYQLEGKLLEVCDCNVLCPCWIGENADNGTCDAVVAYHIDKGTVDGTNVSGLGLALLVYIPGNILQGNWRVGVVVDDKASPQQQEALLNVWTGKLGGPVADLAKLVGEVVTVQRAPITFAVDEGQGTLRIGDLVEADMSPDPGEFLLTPRSVCDRAHDNVAANGTIEDWRPSIPMFRSAVSPSAPNDCDARCSSL